MMPDTTAPVSKARWVSTRGDKELWSEITTVAG